MLLRALVIPAPGVPANMDMFAGWIIPYSLTTPAASRHPSNGGELRPRREQVNAHRLRRGGVAHRATGGWGTSNELRVTPHCHCEGVRSTLKTLADDCGNPGVICLRANARSTFLFTGSPRSFHSLAMTKETKHPSAHHSCHSRARGPRKYECICGVDKAGIGLGLF